MSHSPRNLSPLEAQAVASCFRGTCKAMTFDASSRLVMLQSSGHGGDATGEDAFKPEVLNHVPVVFPYGFLSLAPGGDKVETELLETAAGVLCVAVRTALPSGIPAPAAGDSLQFSSAGSYTHHDADNDVVIEPNVPAFGSSGKVIRLGKNASKKVALDGDAVPPNAAMNTWAGAVETALLGAASPILPASNWAATVTTAGALGTVSASAAKVQGE